MSYELAQKYVDFQIPSEIKQAYKAGVRMAGSLNFIKMMMEDGFFKFLPKGDDAWVNFVKPFLKLTRKEKRNHKQIK